MNVCLTEVYPGEVERVIINIGFFAEYFYEIIYLYLEAEYKTVF